MHDFMMKTMQTLNMATFPVYTCCHPVYHVMHIVFFFTKYMFKFV